MSPAETTVAAAGVRVVSPAPRDAWRAALAADPHAVATQTPEWLDCLCARTGQVDASRLYVRPDGRRLVLPLVARRVAGVRVAEESFPYGWGYGGVLVHPGADGAAARDTVLTEDDCRLVLADLARRPVVRTGVVPVSLAGGPWSAAAPVGAVRVPYRAQVIDLSPGYEQLWSTVFKRQVRNSVRKAERFDLEVRRERGDGPDGVGVRAFAQLYGQSVARWAEQRGQPRWLADRVATSQDRPGQVAAVAAALGERCVVWSAHHEGRPVAVNVVLQHGAHAIGWLAAMDDALARQTLATYVLHCRSLEAAAAEGVRWFHMGESEPGSAPERYKAYFGARPVEYEALRLERLPLTRADRALRRAVARASELNRRRKGQTDA
ncbi:GNAT family N-acetyltransferase [Actinomycetospora cinnamomea]|uniref:CelD/BcsL family acetyltransferase involved in cellulose biosynthesis n=1 Tax=Actinomycetospora cinnamomea TaxID=663609 RepID=A0A2U1FLD0_9PSEU|nr:GNAT family N-acetyltransferase [Actinomycetospora cinnamomea]PVZ13025.1 CelD/BcsL family acetyltransferase involved in cellulose biosynthesis [Actinomycetospora cinnamomea]